MAAISALAIVLTVLGVRPVNGAGSVIGSAFEALVTAQCDASIKTPSQDIYIDVLDIISAA